MHNSDDPTGKKKKDNNQVQFLEPIPVSSFIRHRILKMFIDVGLEDFPSQILISMILHGGQIKPTTLAKDLDCKPSRLELPDGFPRLINLNLIAMSHNRPKTALLVLEIDELLDRIVNRKLVPKFSLTPNEAHSLLNRIDQLGSTTTDVSDEESGSVEKVGVDTFSHLFNYYENLTKINESITSLLPILYQSFTSLWMDEKQAIILAKLICNKGHVPKREFYLDQIKVFDFDELKVDKHLIKDDLKRLGYSSKDIDSLHKSLGEIINQRTIQPRFSSEQVFNQALTSLENYCQSTSMGEKGGKRKFVNLTLIKTLSQLADNQFQAISDFTKDHESEIYALRKAYSNVRLIDAEIFLSSIADSSSTRRRLEADLAHANQIYLVLNHSFFIKDLFQKIFDSENLNSKLDLLVAKELKEEVISSINVYKSPLQGKRGITSKDTVTFTPSYEIPQDILIGNTLILFYEAGSSMISIHEEITRKNPTEINTIPHDVNLAFEHFNEIKSENSEKTMPIISIIDKGGT